MSVCDSLHNALPLFQEKDTQTERNKMFWGLFEVECIIMWLCSIIFVILCSCFLCHCDCLVSLYGNFSSSCGNSVSLLSCFYLFVVALCVFVVILYLFMVTLCPFIFVLLDHWG